MRTLLLSRLLWAVRHSRHSREHETNALRILRKSGPARAPFSSPEPTTLLACGRNRELWPDSIFWACAEYQFRIINQSDLPDLTGSPWIADFSGVEQSQSSRSLPQARRIVGSGDENGPFVRDTSPKSIDREGLGESRTGTRQRTTQLRVPRELTPGQVMPADFEKPS